MKFFQEAFLNGTYSNGLCRALWAMIQSERIIRKGQYSLAAYLFTYSTVKKARISWLLVWFGLVLWALDSDNLTAFFKNSLVSNSLAIFFLEF